MVGGGALGVLLAACYGAPYGRASNVEPLDTTAGCADPSLDPDQDGTCGDLDCNEEDPSIHVGAEDPEGDDIDQDCDGHDGHGPS